MNEHHPPVGAHLLDSGQCTFTVWAPNAKHVELTLGNGAIHPLLPSTVGYWSIALQDIAVGERYTYSLDRKDSLPDPASRRQPDGVHAPSAVTTSAFSWSDHEWRGLSLGDMIIYELHVGTFAEEGTFAGVASKLDYLLDLGVNTIEIMPVAAFPGNRNWGYDGVYPFAVQESYGGMEGLKDLVNEAHKKGIAVLLDVVYNHLGPEGNYFAAYAPYFTDRYKTFWGKAMNFDDAYCDGVRHFYWQNALMWLDEFHVDGLRLDAVHAIWDFSAEHFVDALVERVRTLEQICGRKKVLIAEIDLNNPRYISSREEGGYGLDGQWIDEFHHAVHAVATGEVNGYYEDFGSIDHLAKSFKDSYVYTGEYSIHRKRNFGVSHEKPYDQFVVFVQNHDQVGNRLLGDRIIHSVSAEMLELLASVLILSPHVPLLFMGEEYGEKNPFQYFISHSDEVLVEAVREGRKREFAHFGWKQDVPDPQAEKTFRDCVLSWNTKDKDGRKLLSHYKSLIQFRNARSVYREKDRHAVKVLEVQENAFGFEYKSPDDLILVIFNFSNDDARYRLNLPKDMKTVFATAEGRWNDPDGKSFAKGDQIILLPPVSSLILEGVSK